MKKLLVGSAAIALGLAVAAPAHAQLQLGVAGHFKGYVDWVDQDTNTGGETPAAGHAIPLGSNLSASANNGDRARSLDIVRDTEVHFTGETTLDNGLTVGVHVEAMADAGDSFAVDESYAYFSGAWGRSNFGDEDGAAYLLQIAAPSADSNVDGIRQYVNPVNYTLTDLSGVYTRLDYANDATRHADKLTYLTPVFSGFQAGISYTPTVGTNDALPGGSPPGTNSRTFGNSVNLNQANAPGGSAWEGAARWEGTFQNVGINLGGGYTRVLVNNQTVGNDNFDQWNLGADINVSAFGLGVVYTKNNQASNADHSDARTWVVGGDYTTGPFKLGASWLNNHIDGASPGVNLTTGAPGDVKTNRYSGGVVYTFAPGMSFRGSVGLVRSKADGDIVPSAGSNSFSVPNVDATYALLGTQINF